MIHIVMAVAYLTSCVFYICTQQNTGAQRLHATFCALLVVYSIVRKFKRMSDLPMFMCMQITLYATSGGQRFPYWMFGYFMWRTVQNVMRTGEYRVYTMLSELHRVMPVWGFEFVYTHEALPRIALTTPDEQRVNDVLHTLVDIRERGEVPESMSSDEKLLWCLSDHKTLLVSRWQRSRLFSYVFIFTVTSYGLWWVHVLQSFRAYFLVDILLTLTLMMNFRVRFVAYHAAFLLATIALQYPLFNPAQGVDVLVNQYY